MGGLTVPPSGLIYLDASAIIYSVERHAEYWPILEPMWEAVSRGAASVMTSSLTLLEVLVVPIRNKDQALITDYRTLLESSELLLQPIDEKVLFEAATIRAARNLKSPDSIHAATAMVNSSDLFVTNDRSFRHVAGLIQFFFQT